MTDLPEIADVKVIRYARPTCDTGRHIPPHPGDTCEEIDEWIRLRDAYLTDALRQAFDQALGGEPIPATFTAKTSRPATTSPTAASRALAILRPHLAHEPLYRA